MNITRVEFDISQSRINKEGEISNVLVKVYEAENVHEATVWSNATGTHRGHPDTNETSVTTDNHARIEISEPLAEAIVKMLGFSIDGKALQEMDSTPTKLIFLPVRRSGISS